MSLIRLKSSLAWQNAKGRELVRLDEGADQAQVIAATCSESDLRALSQACLEAADQIAGFKADKAPREAA